MAKFKCKQSGNIFVFESEHDIKGLRKHPEYEEVIEELQSVGTYEELPTVRTVERKPGRPKKEQ